MDYLETLGIDVSKLTIDCHLFIKGSSEQFENSENGFKEVLRWAQAQNVDLNSLLFCFECTGAYSLPLAHFLTENKLGFVMEPALNIKKSLGVTRGKSDAIDAQRIAEYAFEKKHKLSLTQLPSKEILVLKKLLSLRERLVKQRAANRNSLKENQAMLDPKDFKYVLKIERDIIKDLDKKIDSIDQLIDDQINNDPELKRLFTLVTSVVGVGPIVASYFLSLTAAFRNFDDPRKFACYCGIAPFPLQSGTSIRGRTKVNHLANKQMKSLLEMAARTAIQYDPEIKRYYKRRVEAGKNKTSTLNIVRNKIVARVFAVVQRQTPYVKLHGNQIVI